MAVRNSGMPAIGGYWLRPSRIACIVASNSAGSAWKSGNPCDRLMAPHSAARRDMTVKMVVPTAGNLESTAREDAIIVVYNSERGSSQSM